MKPTLHRALEVLERKAHYEALKHQGRLQAIVQQRQELQSQIQAAQLDHQKQEALAAQHPELAVCVSAYRKQAQQHQQMLHSQESILNKEEAGLQDAVRKHYQNEKQYEQVNQKLMQRQHYQQELFERHDLDEIAGRIVDQ